ncbi:MAG TPA: RNA polymerase sigma factor, partial [Limnochordia bacterium]|nr:RNA polymerase sigma factor [Limnochordia bacterium]
ADGEPAPSTLLVREALLQLEEPERSIVYGLYVEGLTYRELAAMLGLPEGTVKSKAHYARKRLYHWLQEGSPK